MHSGRSHGCATTRRATRRGVSEGALQSGSAGAGAARGNAVCGEQAHPGGGRDMLLAASIVKFSGAKAPGKIALAGLAG